jgi:DNA-binding transcriptional MerR regulator
MSPDRVGLRTGEVAEQAGVNIQTLRYYERRGLLAEPVRSNGGHRLYPADTVALLYVIKAAQRLGFTLDEVADLLDAGRHRHPSPDLRQRAIDKIAEIDAKIADLTAIRGALTDVVDAPATASPTAPAPTARSRSSPSAPPRPTTETPHEPARRLLDR